MSDRPSSRQPQAAKPAPATALTCQSAQELLRGFLENQLPDDTAASLKNHLRSCAACTRACQDQEKLHSLLNETLGSRAIHPQFEARAEERLKNRKQLPAEAGTSAKGITAVQLGLRAEDLERNEAPVAASSFTDRLGMAPWWAVSLVLHVLIIVLLGLITMSIGILEDKGSVIVLTSLEKMAVEKPAEEQKKKEDIRDILESKTETPPTDPNAVAPSNIIVPPDILAKAEIGDHFETINLDRPDTQSAFGNPEARMFHSTSGNDEPEGGGGVGGSSLMDNLIGLGGASSPGTGGGWGGGNGTGTGVGNGAGHGSFGQRNGGGRKLMVMRHGGSKATESSVDKALEWLARHQDADGSWHTRQLEGSADWDPGVTGLATLAFLGAGHTEKVGKYKENVRKAIAWMITQQRADGAIGSDRRFADAGGGYGYHHAICGMALAEASAMGRIPETRAAAQKAIDYSCEKHQQGEGSEKLGYRYMPKDAGDTSNCGWFVMQLKSAKVAGLAVNPASFEGAIKFYQSCEANPNEVKKEDDAYDNGKYRYKYQPGTAIGINNTSIGILCKIFTGTKPEEVRGAAMWLMRTNPPAWKADLGPAFNGHPFPMYYTYYTTLTMFQIGGDMWKQWNEGLKTMLLPNQRKDGDLDGSWDPMAHYEKMAGRAYATAMGALSLEVYYRYLPLYRQ